MPNEAITKDTIAYYVGCRVVQAALLNLGCRRDKPVAWLDLTLLSSIRMYALRHLRYDLIIPGRNETATVITMVSRDADRIWPDKTVYRVELVPFKTKEDCEREEIAKLEKREVGTDYPNKAALQALLDQAAALNRHWYREVEMIRVYHPDAPEHSVHCPNDEFSPLKEVPIGEVAKMLEAAGSVATSTLDPDALAFDLMGDPPPAKEEPVEIVAAAPSALAVAADPAIYLPDFMVEKHRRDALAILEFSLDGGRDTDDMAVPLDDYLVLRF